MTDIRSKAIAQNIPYVLVCETKQKNIVTVKIDLETFTPILLFPFEAMIHFFEIIKEYYQNNASEIIPKKLQPVLFDGAELKYGGTLVEQLLDGSMYFDNDKGDVYFTLNPSVIEVNYVKIDSLDELVQKLLVLANDFHARALFPVMGLVKLFVLDSEELITIRDFGMAFDSGSDYIDLSRDFDNIQVGIFALVNTLPFKQVEQIKDSYIKIHKEFGHESIEDTVEGGWDEFLLYKAKKEF